MSRGLHCDWLLLPFFSRFVLNEEHPYFLFSLKESRDRLTLINSNYDFGLGFAAVETVSTCPSSSAVSPFNEHTRQSQEVNQVVLTFVFPLLLFDISILVYLLFPKSACLKAIGINRIIAFFCLSFWENWLLFLVNSWKYI